MASRPVCPRLSIARCGNSSRASSTPGPTRTESSAFTIHRGDDRTTMSIPFNIGVLQLSMEPVRETGAMATACEQAGFDAFGVAEAYPWWRKHGFEARSSTAILAVIATQTKSIQLGWGIIWTYT